MKVTTDSKCRMCTETDETMNHLVAGCQKLAATEYLERHNKVAAALHLEICRHYGIPTAEQHPWLHRPETVNETDRVKILWDFEVRTDKVITARRPDIIVVDKQEKTAKIIDVAIPLDKNIRGKEAEKTQKYQDLKLEIQKLWDVKAKVIPIVIGALGAVSTSLERHLQRAPGEHDMRKLMKQAILGSAHILRRVLDLPGSGRFYRSKPGSGVTVNNAAMSQFGKFESVSMKQMQALFQTNFFGTARITQEIVTHMKKRKSGHIIFVSLILGLRPLPFADFYVATKFALEGLVGSLAPVLRCFNISVTSVEPGPVNTSMADNLEINGQGLSPLQHAESSSSEDETDALLKTFLEKYFPVFLSHEESKLLVAEVIKDCIYQANPPVRIQPGDSIRKLAREILIDHTGNKNTDDLSEIKASCIKPIFGTPTGGGQTAPRCCKGTVPPTGGQHSTSFFRLRREAS
ncbi:Retinol dehydrogenase 8 [Holothuria leucospilota]|uniref:Retinol dehydrogenase 8 n=1 Tax=Holothuria leucospilota TaxID=206669 RepID=A0A9Q1H5P0_HOLLE|nr:Retinol dehydrogenase 8 [Holothuria leucospilota]